MPYDTCFAGLYFSWINSNPYYLWYGVKFYEKIVFPLDKNRVEGTAHPPTRYEQSKSSWLKDMKEWEHWESRKYRSIIGFFFWWVYMMIFISWFLFGL